MDTTSYTPDLIQFIKSIGNARSNFIWEATLNSSDQNLEIASTLPQKHDLNLTVPTVSPKIEKNEGNVEPVSDSDWDDLINMITPSASAASVSPSIRSSASPSISPTPSPTPSPTNVATKKFFKPSSNDSREVKQKFIIAKYVDRAFVDFSLVDDDRTATDLLFEAVKSNNVPLAMQAVALRADVNAARRFEVANDHGLKMPLLLALLHIDPSLMTVENGRTLFPMAELLLQNGAHVEKVLFDDLEDMLGAASQPITRSSAKSVGTWAAEVVSDMKKSGKTTLDVVQASENIAAIRYFTPKVLARGSIPILNDDPNSLMIITSTGAIVGGTVAERKPSPTIGRSISVSTKKSLL